MEATYRWIDGPLATDEDWDAIEKVLAARGWTSLSREFSKIVVCEKDDEMAFMVFQALPYCGPLYVPPSMRGNGVAEELTETMLKFLVENKSRGWVVSAESPHAAKLCEEHGMIRVKVPIYVMPYPGGVEV